MRADTLRGLAAAAVLAMASAALAHDDDDDDGLRFVRSSLVCKKYNGADDDLLTAGLGKTGLGERAAAADSGADRPDRGRSCRRPPIWNNYRALADMSIASGSGNGTLHVPD